MSGSGLLQRRPRADEPRETRTNRHRIYEDPPDFATCENLVCIRQLSANCLDGDFAIVLPGSQRAPHCQRRN